MRKAIELLSLSLQVEYFERLQFFLKRQYPLVQTLELILDQPLSPKFSKLTAQWLMALKSGKTEFSEMNLIHPTLKLFIQNGMQAQTLPHFLGEGLHLIKIRQEFRSKIIQAGLYPGIVLIFSVILFIFLSIWVLPQLVGFFQDANLALPAALDLYLKLKKVLPWIFLVIVLNAVFGVLFYRKQFKKLFQEIHQKILKKLCRVETWVDFQVLPWLMGFKAFIQLGWTEVAALQASLSLSPHFENLINVPVLVGDLQSGKNFSQAFQNQKQSPRFLRQQLMLVAGEHDLLEVLKNLEDYYRAKNEKFLKMATALLEPLLIGGMGLLVGALVIFVFFPLLQSMQNVSF